jgi:hypothetical protein
MLRSRLDLLVLSGLLGGCVSAGGVSGLFGGTVQQGAPLPEAGAAAQIAMTGQVLVPSPVADLISNNANALIGNNANALIGNNVAALRILGLDARGVAQMRVAAFAENNKDRRVSDIVTTDADGRFRLKVPAGVVLLEATYQRVRLLGLATAQEGVAATVDAATTLATAQLLQAGGRLADHAQDVDTLARELAGKVDGNAASALYEPEDALRTHFARLAAGDAKLTELAAKLAASPSGQAASATPTPSGTATPTPATGGATARTKSSVTVSSWPVADSFKLTSESPPALEAKTGRVHLHNAPAIKKGDKVRFSLLAVDDAFELGKFPAYLRFKHLGGAETKVGINVIGPSDSASDPYKACPETASKSCLAVGGVRQYFEITLDQEVTALEFGGENGAYTARLTAIEVNFDLP